MKIWFEPHGTTPDNEAKKASGWNDVDLSETGLRNAQELIERSKSRSIEAIFCSDLQRAVKTAIPTSNELHIPVYPDQRLRECDYGDFTGKPGELIESERPKRISEPFPNGESYQQAIERIAESLKWIKTFDYQTVMIIGHRATHYGLDYVIEGKSLEDCVSQHFVWQPGWEYELK
jgi:alpha-ribazole phosphatase/probable phosphoglycerate mutase